MANRWNVVFVVVDALRADRVGAYSGKPSLTPNIDAIADEGTVFTNAFACSNATDPSITSIHSGRQPRSTVYHHGPFIQNEEKARIESVDTLPELLAKKGFNTVAAGRYLGRWHSNGFETYPDLPLQSKLVNLKNSLERYNPGPHHFVSAPFKLLEILLGTSLSSERTTTDKSAIDNLAGALDKRQFYGFLHLMDTHTPYEPETERLKEVYRRGEYSQKDFDEIVEANPENSHVVESLQEWTPFEEPTLGHFTAAYDTSVIEADEKIGYLVERLQAADKWEDTAVVIMSDHGESLTENGIFFDQHGLYEPTVRVPLIVRLPQKTQDSVGSLVQLTDLMPTVLELLDFGCPPSVDGQSLTPLLFNEPDEWEDREAIVIEEAQAQRRTAVRTRDWKYIRYVPDEHLEKHVENPLKCRYCNTVHEREEELYELGSKDGESKNVATENPDIVAELEDHFSQFERDIEHPDQSSDRYEYDEEDAVMERLKELGYR